MSEPCFCQAPGPLSVSCLLSLLVPWTPLLASVWPVSLDLECLVSSDSDCCLCSRRPGILGHEVSQSDLCVSVFNPTPPELVTEVEPLCTAPGGATHTYCDDLESVPLWK